MKGKDAIEVEVHNPQGSYRDIKRLKNYGYKCKSYKMLVIQIFDLVLSVIDAIVKAEKNDNNDGDNGSKAGEH
eukprot:2402855-Ditylum_brightwellii.AAC.1